MISRFHPTILKAWHLGLAAAVLVAALIVVTVVRERKHAKGDAPPPINVTPVASDADASDEPNFDEPALGETGQGEHVPQELELLQQIRRQIGSPLDTSVFGGAAGEGLDDNSFDEIYQRAASEQKAEAVIPTRSGWDAVATDPELVFRAALRDAARQLDQSAAALEDLQSYDRADALRNWATKLREDARVTTPDTEPAQP